MVSMINLVTLRRYLDNLEVAGCAVEIDRTAGIAKAVDDSVTVLQAIQKHRNGPWVTRFTSGPHVSWGPDCPHAMIVEAK
jgi:hypothetical protein